MKKENDKYKAEKTGLSQKVKTLENQIEELKADIDKKGDSSKTDEVVEELKKEVEQLSITNTVYLDKINELIEQMNKMDEESYSSLEEVKGKYAKLKKQYDELVHKAHMAGVE